MTMPAQRVVPALRITDYERSKAFYVNGLGFTVDWEHRFGPQFPVFMSLVRDGMQLYLSQHAGDCQVGGLVHFLIPDIDAWHLGFWNMTVTDPDGNQLRFMVPATENNEPDAASERDGR